MQAIAFVAVGMQMNMQSIVLTAGHFNEACLRRGYLKQLDISTPGTLLLQSVAELGFHLPFQLAYG